MASRVKRGDDPTAHLLNERQEHFVAEYLVDMNSAAAARRAGYSVHSAKVTGHALLQQPKIQARIASMMDARAKRHEITVDRVLAELAKIGFANIGDFVQYTTEDRDPFINIRSATTEQMAALSEITIEDFKDGRGEDARDVRRVKIKLADKRAALVDIGRHIGMFKDRVELTGPGGGPLLQRIERVVIDPKAETEDDDQ